MAGYQITTVHKPGVLERYSDVQVTWSDLDGTSHTKVFGANDSAIPARQAAQVWADENVSKLITQAADRVRQEAADKAEADQQLANNQGTDQATRRDQALNPVAPPREVPSFGARTVAPRLPDPATYDTRTQPPPLSPTAASGLPSVDFLAEALLDGRIPAADNAARAKAGDPTAIAVQDRALQIATERGFFDAKPPGGGAPAGPGGGAPAGPGGAPAEPVAPDSAGWPEAPITIDPTKLDSDEMYNLVKAGYGWAAMYLKDSELGPIIREAAARGWGENEIQGAIQNTKWWQTTEKAARDFDISRARDPATQNTLISRRMQEISTAAMSLGLNIVGIVDLGEFGRYNKAYYMAVQSLREGWTGPQLKAAVFEEGGFDPVKAQRTGVIKQQAYTLKQQAAEFMLPMSDETANRYAAEMLTGKMDSDSFTAILTDQAKMRFPTLAPMIDRGATPWKFFDSYRTVIADTLEMDANQVDFMNPQFSEVLDFVDPASGKTRFMTLTEARSWAKTRTAWDSTQQAADAAQRASKTLNWSFGSVPNSAGLTAEYSRPFAK